MKQVSREQAVVFALAVCAACGRTSPHGASLVNGDQLETDSVFTNVTLESKPMMGSSTEASAAGTGERTTSSATEDSGAGAGESTTESLTEDAGVGAIPEADASAEAAPDAAGTETAPEMCTRDAVIQTCQSDSNGLASCDCDNGLSGPECNQLWQPLDPPPFIRDVSFDTHGNAWFCTSLGLVYWNLNGTPKDTSDDAWQLVDTERSCSKVNIDSDERVWTASGSSIDRLAHNGTPLDPSDDEWQSYTLETHVARFRLDRQDRAWLLQSNASGIKLLPDIALFGAGEIPWINMFDAQVWTDAAGDADGVWLASGSGVFYVHLGTDIFDVSDDDWQDFSATPALAGKRVDTIVVDSTGGKWFNTDAGVIHLDDRGDPFDAAKHTWTPWPPEGGEASGVVMAIAPDGAQWLKTPWGAALRVDEDGARTEYNLVATTLFSSFTYRQSATSVALDPRERVWLVAGGELYHFDDGQTPTDISDDVWTHVGKPRSNASLHSVYSGPDGGAWVREDLPTPFNGLCRQSFYYVDIGDARDAFDDVWTRYFAQDETGPCWTLHGIDARGNHWLTNGHYIIDEPAQHIVMNVGGTPRDESDDIRTFHSADDSGISSSRFAGFDPSGGLWFEDGHLDYGDSIESTADDVWVTVDSFRPQTVAVDAARKRWFGYRADAGQNVGIGGALRFFDDGGTLSNTDDDIWVDFSPADGLPFYEPGATFFSVSDVQIDARNLKWLVNGRSGSETEPNLCTLDDNHTPLDKCDDTWTVYMPNPELGNPHIYQMAMDSRSDLWLATASGLRYLHVLR